MKKVWIAALLAATLLAPAAGWATDWRHGGDYGRHHYWRLRSHHYGHHHRPYYWRHHHEWRPYGHRYYGRHDYRPYGHWYRRYSDRYYYE